MTRLRPLVFLCLLCSSIAVGCQVPSYKLPGGFSSTYYRYLYGDIKAAPLDDAVPEPGPLPDDPGVFYPQSFRYDPPTKSDFERSALVPENRPAGRRRF